MTSSEFDPALQLDAEGAQTSEGPSPQASAPPEGSVSRKGLPPDDRNVAAGSPPHQPHHADAAATVTRKVGAYVIESGVTMPDFKSQAARGRYPFGEMKIGESVVIQGVEEKTLDGARRSWLVRRGIDLRKVRVEGGFRVFRVA